MEKEHVNVVFSKPTDVGPRDWGREILFGIIPDVCSGKILKMNKGAKGGLQKHRLKNELAHLLEGRLMFRYDNGDGKISEHIMEECESVHIPPGAMHQEEALTDCTIIEISTPHFNDRVRIEEEYGLPKPEGGLPTTQLEDIKNAP